MKRILPIMICLALLLSAQAFAVSLTSVEINQIIQENEKLYVFFHADDENDEQISGLEDGDVRLELGGQNLSARMENTGAAGIGFVFAVDVSASLSAEQFAGVQEALKNWVGRMGSEDMAAIVTFGETVTVVTDFTDNQNTLAAVINGLSASESGTALYSGAAKAVDIANRRSAELPLQRAVVILSDGMNDSSDASSLSAVKTKAVEAGISLYVAGVKGSNNVAQLAQLSELTAATGGRIVAADKDSLAESFDSLSGYIGGGFMLSAEIPTVLADGSEKGLILTVSHGGITVDDSRDLRIKLVAEQTVEEQPQEASEPNAEQVTDDAESVELETTPEQAGEEDTIDEAAVGISANGTNGKPAINELYVYIGAGVVSLGGMTAFVIVSLKKRRGKKAEKGNALDNGYGGYGGGYGGDTMPIDETERTQTVKMDEYGSSQLVLTDAARGRSYSLTMNGNVTIGRRQGSNDIIIADGTVSGKHCEIVQENGRFYVRDVGSSHGTYVVTEGLRYQADGISGREIKVGDQINIGNTRLEISSL